MQERKGGFGAGVLTGILIGVAVLGCLCWLGILVFLGTGARIVSGDTPGGAPAPGSSVTPSVKSKFLTQEEMEKLDGLFEIISDDYLYEVKRDELVEGIYHGLFDALNEPYSTYYTAEEYATVTEESSGSYVGIGVSVSTDKDTGLIHVMRVFKGSPAEEAGLRENDLIMSADGTDLRDMDLNIAVTYIRGEENTKVHVVWMRDGVQMENDVARRQIENETVTWEMLDDNIGYILLAEFDTVSSNQFATAMKDLEAQGMKGLILDLRSNPGGLVNVATDIAGEFLPKGVVTTLRDKKGNEETYRIRDNVYSDVPLVVLINENSASASELLTAALMDNDRASVVGVVSFGKGIVQEVLGYGDGSGIRLTIADYYSPKGTNIHGVGITPDVIVENDPDTEADEQLDRALEEIRKRMGQ
ncbi:MAG: S41 family peptidase [Lachnospiraceae bacterium]|nr:S41 family peptidase [Lachnospiraceae bacterium]